MEFYYWWFSVITVVSWISFMIERDLVLSGKHLRFSQFENHPDHRDSYRNYFARKKGYSNYKEEEKDNELYDEDCPLDRHMNPLNPFHKSM